MVKVSTIKIPWKTKHFNEGQMVFVKMMSGNQACLCRGKYRGKFRYISAWFKWNDSNRSLVEFKEIEIDQSNYNKIMGQ